MQTLQLPQGALNERLIAVLASLLLLSACINPSKDVYQAHDVGRMIDTTEATVVSSRIVNIKQESRGYGPLAGAAVGATGVGLGSRGSRNAGWLIALGGLAGAGAGLLAEQAARSRDGIEYLVRTSDGRMMTLVQNRANSEVPIAAGKAVLVQYGSGYTRVIEKPEVLEDQWRNPDAPGGGGGGGDVQPRTSDPAGLGSNRPTPAGSGSPDPFASRAYPRVPTGSSGAQDQ